MNKLYLFLLFGLGMLPLCGGDQPILSENFDSTAPSFSTPWSKGRGWNGTSGVVFAQENLEDFKADAPNLQPTNAITWPLKGFPAENGEFSFRFKPYFNQLHAYPSNPKHKLILYYLANADQGPGKPQSFSIYMMGSAMTLEFTLADGKKFTIRKNIQDWKPREWHSVRFIWTPSAKTFEVDGQTVKSVPAAGPLGKAVRLSVGGNGSTCSAQAVFDDICLSRTVPEFDEGFSTLEDFNRKWELVKLDGATGTAEIDTTIRSASGSPTLKLTKTNNKGFLMLKLRKDFRDIKPGTYRISGRYHSGNASPDNMFFYRFLRGDRNPVFYEGNPNSGYIYPVYTLLVNTPAGHWSNCSYYTTVNKEETGKQAFHCAVILRGSPCSVNLEKLSLTAIVNIPGEPFPEFSANYTPVKFEKEFLLSREEAIARTRVRKPATIEIRQEGRTPLFLLNGKPDAPILYLLQCANPRSHYLEMNRDAGVRLFLLHCSVGGGKKRGYNIMSEGVGKYDFRTCDEEIINALRKAPDATLLLRVTVGPYPGIEKDPDEIWQDKEGLFAVSNTENMLEVNAFVREKSGRQQYYPSYASKKWQKACGDALEAYIRHLHETGLLNAFAGVNLSLGEDGQFLTWWMKRDFSPAVRRGFADYLRKKYSTVEKLREAWHNPKAEFNFPSARDLPGYDGFPKKDFLDPRTDAALLDAMAYHNDMQLETAAYFFRRIQEVAGRPLFTNIMTPGSLNKSWLDQLACGETGIQSCRDCIFYSDRRPGRPAAPTAAYDSMRANGILCIDELDIRTYNECSASDTHNDWVGRCTTPEMFRTVLNKITGYQIAKGMGYWYYDMNQYFAQAPELHAVMRQNGDIARKVMTRPDTFKPDVAVILDHDSIFYYAFGVPQGKLAQRTIKLTSNYLAASGVPYDMFYLRDFLKHPEKRSDYKTIIFLSALRLDAPARMIVDGLKKSGRTLVFLYPAGLLSADKGLSAETASKVMGISITEYGRENLLLEPTGQSPIVKGLEGCLGISDLLCYSCYPYCMEDMPRYVVSDPDAEILGKYISDGKPGIALKKHPGWTGIYIGSPDGLSAALMHNIARSNGSFIAVDKPGVNLAMRDNFMSLHALRSGDYTVRFPKHGKIIDPVTEKILAENSDTAKVHLEAGQTLWLELR